MNCPVPPRSAQVRFSLGTPFINKIAQHAFPGFTGVHSESSQAAPPLSISPQNMPQEPSGIDDDVYTSTTSTMTGNDPDDSTIPTTTLKIKGVAATDAARKSLLGTTCADGP